jgi:hypothetical protein
MNSGTPTRRPRARSFDDQPPVLLRALSHRSWYLLIPILAIAWVTEKRIEPGEKALAQQLAEERDAAERERIETLAAARTFSVRMSMLRALVDTFEVRFGQVDAVADTVRKIQENDLAEIRRLEQQLDSLRVEYSIADAQSQATSDSLTMLQATVDSLNDLAAQLADERIPLEEAALSDLDTADRIKNPDKYRKNTALVTGAGDYPNRDELPER